MKPTIINQDELLSLYIENPGDPAILNSDLLIMVFVICDLVICNVYFVRIGIILLLLVRGLEGDFKVRKKGKRFGYVQFDAFSRLR